MEHSIVHVELASNDPKDAAKFYADVFGWKTEEVPQMDYVTCSIGPQLGGGFPRVDNQMFKPGDVIVYISTDNIEATLTRIESLGGKTLQPKTEIPGMGWFALFSDPTGNRLGLFAGMGQQPSS